MRRLFIALSLLPFPAAAQDAAARMNDYPTAVRADYVFACMAANGQRQDVLQKCACSIDEIAGILPYEDYEAAETVLTMRQVGGERVAAFRSAAETNTMVEELRRAQAEAEIICF